MRFFTSITRLFKRDYLRSRRCTPVNVYMMRLFFTLMFVFVSFDSWSAIVQHEGPWNPTKAAALCMFAAYSAISVLGVFNTLKMLPIMAFMIFYKTLWLIVVAYPLWMSGELAGSEAEGMANVFIWVLLPMLGMPWGYFYRNYCRVRHARPVHNTAAAGN